MRVTVRLFARPRASTRNWTARCVDLGDGARSRETSGGVRARRRARGPRRQPRLRRRGQALAAGGRGRAHTACFGRRVSPSPRTSSTSPQIVAEVEDERAGATATFVGTVRAQSRAGRWCGLEYEAYEGMAENVMADLAGAAEWSATTSAPSRSHTGWGSARSADASVGDRRLRPASPGRARRLQGRDRHAQGNRAPWKKEVAHEGGEEWDREASAKEERRGRSPAAGRTVYPVSRICLLRTVSQR